MSEEKSALQITFPSAKDLFATGAQFGHQTKRWNPKMEKFIYTIKNGIHIIDVTKTEILLKESAEFVADAASRGVVLIVGTKKQSSDIVKKYAIESGSYFVDMRWAGGLLTNFSEVKKSLIRLKNLENDFENGVEGRTKYEVSLMKKEWSKLNRLYSGIKEMNDKPTAIVVVDTNFEKSAVREAKLMRIPVVGIVDSNSDPDSVNYAIPANDDAISSIEIILKTLAEAIKQGNKGNGIKHALKDYSKQEVKIVKQIEIVPEDQAKIAYQDEVKEDPKMKVVKAKSPGKSSKAGNSKGILERVQEAKEKAKTSK